MERIARRRRRGYPGRVGEPRPRDANGTDYTPSAVRNDGGESSLLAEALSIPDSWCLRVSPALRQPGFQGICPAQRALLRAKGDAMTGINRADSASVKPIRLWRPPASGISGRLWTASAGRDG